MSLYTTKIIINSGGLKNSTVWKIKQLNLTKCGKRQVDPDQDSLPISAMLINAIRKLYSERTAERRCYTNDLHDALMSKSGESFFWKCWKSKFNRGGSASKFIDELAEEAKNRMHLLSIFVKLAPVLMKIKISVCNLFIITDAKIMSVIHNKTDFNTRCVRSNSLGKLGAEWANGRDAHKKFRGCAASLSLIFLASLPPPFPSSFIFTSSSGHS